MINSNDFPYCREEGSSILFVDDDTDIVDSHDEMSLKNKIQHEAELSCSWLKDNRMIVAGEKSKLLIISTRELRKSKISPNPISIEVDGKTVTESKSEKLLGVVLNNNLTWSDHPEGEHWRAEDNFPGLIAQLSQRVGLLQKLSYSTSKQKLKMFASSIFYSKFHHKRISKILSEQVGN